MVKRSGWRITCRATMDFLDADQEPTGERMVVEATQLVTFQARQLSVIPVITLAIEVVQHMVLRRIDVSLWVQPEAFARFLEWEVAPMRWHKETEVAS